MLRITPSVAFALVICVTTGCSDPMSGYSIREEPHPGPPIAVGHVCVDVTPSDAVVTVGGQVATGRCTRVEQAYSSSVPVEVSAPGYVSQTLDAPVIGGSDPLTVVLEEMPVP